MNKDNQELYQLIDLRLESIAEKLLLSKVNESDEVYFNIVSHIEDIFIQAALRITDNNISKAAKLLGINRNTLSKRLRVPSQLAME